MALTVSPAMYAFLIITAYLVINVFMFINFHVWTGAFFKGSKPKLAVRIILDALFWLAASCMVAQAYFPTDMFLYRQFKVVSSYWIAVMIYGGFTALIADLLYLVLRFKVITGRKGRGRYKKLFGVAGVVLCVLMIVFGHMNATNIRIKSFEMTAASSGSEISGLKIAMVGDFHLGYNAGLSLMEQMVEKINAEEPDLIIIVGDIFDNNFDAIKDPDKVAECLSRLSAKYGVYAILGNHDIDEQLFCGFDIVGNSDVNDTAYLNFLKDADITLLTDESVLIADSVYLVGREDISRAVKKGVPRTDIEELLEGLDKDKAIIVLDHQPIEYDAVREAGADIELSGHTHNGQVFPENLLIGILWDNAYGYKTFGELQTLVTCGVGSWGPYIRTGSNTASEIMLIDLILS